MERYAITLADSLVKLGCRVVFHAHKTDRELAQSLGVETALLKVPKFPRKLRDFRYFRQVDRRLSETEGPQIALSRVRVRDMVICGGTHRGYLARARKWSGPLDWLQIWMETEAYRSARTVVSHSDLCTEELTNLYSISPGKIVTLYPPVDERFLPKSDPQLRAESRRQLGLPIDKPLFLFPSMGHSRKGLKPICEALKGLSEPFLLAVAGKPAGNLKHPFVHSLGYIEDMAVAYRAADFTILGSYYEPFGLVGPESILCGTRLVFEQDIGCLAAIKPEFALTFSVWDRESIRQAVSQAIALAQRGEHRISHPLEALRFNPSAEAHARVLLARAT
ncbi:MAG TPA: glycosyltransferase [Clostridia bacterium]|nr:glycosyltransferase [Clostridia bacterium]